MKKILFSLLMLLALVAVPLAQTNPAVSTTITVAASATDTIITLASATGIADNYGIYINGEYMTVNPTWTSGGRVPVMRGQLGTVARAHIDNATALIGPPGMFTTADAGPGACPSVPQQYLVSVNTVNGNVWLCRAIDGVSREWTATNTRHLTYNSLLITG